MHFYIQALQVETYSILGVLLEFMKALSMQNGCLSVLLHFIID